MRETDPRSIAGKMPAPDRHVPLVVVGAGAAGVAAAIEAARVGVEVVLIDEHPVDNDMMAMDVPLCFGQRMDGSVRNRALMLERVVETNPELASAHEAGVDVQLGTYVWGAFVNGPAVQELPVPMLGLADDRRSWLLGYDRLIVAAGARDVLLGFPGWERAGTLGAGGAAALLARYRALAARRVVVLGSGALGLHTASLALERGIEVAGIVEVDARVRGDAARAEGRSAGRAAAESLGAARGREDETRRRVSAPPTADETHRYWRAWLDSLIAAGGWEVNVCQCEEVTRRELVETKPPRYLGWQSPQMSARSVTTLLRDGPLNQDQIKRLTRAGMGPCQSRRCREQVGLLLAQAAGTTIDRIPLPTFRPPIRPLPLNVRWPPDEPAAMREEWVSWFGIPTQFSPHWTAGMAIDEPTAHARLILSEE